MQMSLRHTKTRIVLLVDLQDFFSDLMSGDEKKSSENDQLTALKMTSVFFLFFFF